MAVYDSARRPPARWQELIEAYRYRDLIRQLISRDVRMRYKRSVLGIAWTMAHPLLMMIVLAVVFSQVFRVDVPHYPTYLLTGLLVWNFFSLSTTQAMRHLAEAGPLITKIYLPKTTFALAAVGTGAVNLALAIVPLLLIMAATGVPFSFALLILPVPALLVAGFTLGVGLLLSGLAIRYPDVVTMYEIALAAWYFATPLIYPTSVLGPGARALVALNPMTYFVEAFRAPVVSATLPDAGTLAVAAVVSAGTLVIGWISFAAGADEIPTRL